MGHGDIEAYMYQADLWCPTCIVETLTGESPLYGMTEKILDLLAMRCGINRADEGSFDSDDFPKVLLGQSLNDERRDHCGGCGDCLDHDASDCEAQQDQICSCCGDFNCQV